MMSPFRFVLRSLFHFWRTNLAVLLGVCVATAVIGGALLVGDSVRASLRQLTFDRLGKIDASLTGFRFFREELTDKIASANAPGQRLAPVLLLTGSLERQHSSPENRTNDVRALETHRRAGQVQIYGLDQRAWDFVEHARFTAPAGTDVILGSRTADALAASVGDAVTLWLELPANVPRDTLLGQRDDETAELTLTVAGIAPEDCGLSRLSLQANQQLPLTAFVNLAALQDRLDLSSLKPSRSDRLGRPARINTILATAENEAGARELTERLQATWTLADLSLRLAAQSEQNLLNVDSAQMFLETRLADAILKTASDQRLAASPVQVYLANWLRNAQDESAYSMYSVVAGLDVLSTNEELFGTWEFLGPRPEQFSGHDIIVNEWLAEDLKVNIGDPIRLGYHVVGSHGELPEIETTFTVVGIVKLAGAAADSGLIPQVKGITDAETFGDWDQPFPMKLDLVTKRDDAYWAHYRATPKAFVPLATSQELWRSRYGELTSIRLASPDRKPVETLKTDFESQLMHGLSPAAMSMAFQPVKEQGLKAAAGATDFTGLFVGFSFFLILAATILIGLLLRLGIEQRVRHWGLLGALGFSPRQIQRLLLWEGGLLAVCGGVLGIPAAIGYAALMIRGLTTWWVGAIRTTHLFLHVNPLSLLMGLAIALAAAASAILWGVRQLKQTSPREQLSGQIERTVSREQQRKLGRRARRRALISAGIAFAMVAASLLGIVPSGEAFSGLGWPVIVFFLAGMLLLAASLWFLSSQLQSDHAGAVRGHGTGALAGLGLRNASRQRTRSVLTTGLIASATFVIAAVAAGQINPSADQPRKFSGNGGFTLVAESSRPILYDLNTPAGRKQLGIIETPESPTAELWSRIRILQFRVNPGEEASCLNLFQTRLPTVLGAPREMIDRGGFTFADSGADPWKRLLENPQADPVPVLGDMNTLMFSLKKGIGDEIPIPNPDDPQHQLKIAGMFNGAVFQGVLVMSDDQFERLYPERSGYQYFLIETNAADVNAALDLLETRLAPYGFDAEPVAVRLARFLSVQNTYLSTFQTLGGLGLLLGTLGLATVMLRNVWERQSEFALFRAVGFSQSGISWLVLFENAFLLSWGLLAGLVSAWIAMSPHLQSTGANVPWVSILILFAAVFGFGMLAAIGAVVSAVRVPIVATLRGE